MKNNKTINLKEKIYDGIDSAKSIYIDRPYICNDTIFIYTKNEQSIEIKRYLKGSIFNKRKYNYCILINGINIDNFLGESLSHDDMSLLYDFAYSKAKLLSNEELIEFLNKL